MNNYDNYSNLDNINSLRKSKRELSVEDLDYRSLKNDKSLLKRKL